MNKRIFLYSSIHNETLNAETFRIFQINRVKKEGNVGKGITFEGFKCFYNVLFGGADLERAMFFLDTEKNGINR